MTHTKLGLLGLCAMLLGLMAVNVAGANAAAQWLFAEKGEGTKLVPFLEAELELSKDKNKEGKELYVLHSEILKIKVLFLCTEIKADAKLISEGRIGTEGKPEGARVLFSGCTTDFNGSPENECTPPGGLITTEKGHAVLTLTELPGGIKDDAVKVLPDTGETFTVIKLPAACPIGTSVPVIGKLFLKDCENLALTHLVKHLVEPLESETPEMGTELWTISKTTEHKATLLGSAFAFLKGAHEGLKFSGDPE